MGIIQLPSVFGIPGTLCTSLVYHFINVTLHGAVQTDSISILMNS